MDGPANLSELIPNTVIDTCIYPIGIALQHILLQKYISLGLIPSDTVYHNHFATYRIIFSSIILRLKEGGLGSASSYLAVVRLLLMIAVVSIWQNTPYSHTTTVTPAAAEYHLQ